MIVPDCIGATLGVFSDGNGAGETVCRAGDEDRGNELRDPD